ncbi:hypothetical protein M426DRAFT_68456 [Hypoxylon sp. CI-4A]|nr:hypothetical protein M426DRAFT_68456 [Hypoxylon sp. CI-4A]
MGTVRIDTSELLECNVPNMDFHDTAFFQTSRPEAHVPQLPTPAVIRKAHSIAHPVAQGTIRFEALNLFVKFGPPYFVRREEALALRAMNKAFPDNRVPTPELYGWKEDEGDIFIYMSLVRGSTLQGAWDSLTRDDKESICTQLSQIVVALREIEAPSAPPSLGSITGGRVQDLYFLFSRRAGPFPDVKAFHDALSAEAIPNLPGLENPSEPYRGLLPNMAKVYFTHGDLNRKNIIVSDAPGPRKIAAVVDWEQAGWYPEYWEYCKLLISESYAEEWRDAGWADKVMTIYEDEFEIFSKYCQWRRP